MRTASATSNRRMQNATGAASDNASAKEAAELSCDRAESHLWRPRLAEREVLEAECQSAEKRVVSVHEEEHQHCELVECGRDDWAAAVCRRVEHLAESKPDLDIKQSPSDIESCKGQAHCQAHGRAKGEFYEQGLDQ